MKKRLISFMVAVVMLFSMLCPAVYADNKAVSFDTCTHEWETPLRSGYSITIPGTDVSLSVKTEQCTKCKWYKHIATIFIAEFTYYSPLNVDANGLVPAELATYWANVWYNTFGKNATASQWTAGGGSTDGSGVGRHPSGYADDNGTPSVSNEGSNIYKLEPYYWVEGYFKLTNGKTSNRDVDYYPIACPYWDYSDHVIDVNEYPDLSFSGNTLSFVNSRTYYSYGVVYGMSAPVAGLYKIYKKPSVASWSNTYTSGSLSYNAIGYFSNKNFSSEYVKAGTSLYWQFGHYYGNNSSGNLKISASELYVSCIPSQTTINQQTNITINNNTWNGNIYVDSSTNLTYIYPEYTTINENNETVTNISTNPIIYNNETKQYYTYDSVTNNYYYITYEITPTPTPSPTPAPTWTPGGGATRGGGVGRTPSDTDAADWTLHYYVLNNRRYDAYYALKKTEVDTETKLPWVDNKKYISTTQIPIANGQYTVSVPDGVYWRVWSWDEASQTLTGVNSSNWHSTINNFLFNATGEYIFEFCKADGSDFDTAKDVTLKLKNDKITDYEDGGTIVEEPTPSPSPEPTETPSPTEPPTPTPAPTDKPSGGDKTNNFWTIIFPNGGDSGDGKKGIFWALVSLILALIAFFTNLSAGIGYLFPFLPDGVVMTFKTCLFVVFLFTIIKFVMRSK